MALVDVRVSCPSRASPAYGVPQLLGPRRVRTPGGMQPGAWDGFWSGARKWPVGDTLVPLEEAMVSGMENEIRAGASILTIVRVASGAITAPGPLPQVIGAIAKGRW